MSNTQLTTLTSKLAAKFDLGDGSGLLDTLKKTAFKGAVSDEQMTALLIVANQYKLNPWTSEIYAFPSNGGIVPVVGVDGWARIINGNGQFDGMEFEQDAESCTCKIYRKDRSHPVSVTEFMEECKRDTKPWKSHPRRMLRHKAMIQAARLAFGFAGIFDEDEAERIKTLTITSKGRTVYTFGNTTQNPAPKPAAQQPKKQERQPGFKCADCGKPVEPSVFNGKSYSAWAIAENTTKKYGRCLCWDCYMKLVQGIGND